MSSADEIIARVDAGEQAAKIALLHPWVSLKLDEREQLFTEAEKKGSNGEQLIQVLNYLTINQTESKWDSIRAASLNFRYLPWDEERKRKILLWIEKALEDIRKTLTQNKTEEIQRYRRYKAEVSVLKALYYLEVDNINNALQNYREALAQYQDCGPKEQIIKISEQIHLWEAIQNGKEHVLPIDQFESERLRLQQILSDLSAREIKLKAEEERLNKENAESQKRIDDLNASIDEIIEQEKEILERRDQLDAEINNERTELDRLENEIKERKVAIDFLVYLQHSATAPIWIEVLKLAVKQGQMDELTREAAQRLAIAFPEYEEAEATLAEIVARSPNRESPEIEAFLTKSKHWMVKIAEARKYLDQDLLKAAHLLTEAWGNFLEIPT